MKQKKWYSYLWIVELLYLCLGLFNILFAWLGMLFFTIPLLIAVFGGGKAYCNRYCGRGQLLGLLGEKLKEKGCPKVVVCDLAREDMAEAVEDAFRYGKLVLATITYNGDIFPFMRTFIEHLKERNYQNRTIGLIENGSWASTAGKVIAGMLEKSKNITMLEKPVKIMSSLSEENLKELDEMAEELMK